VAQGKKKKVVKFNPEVTLELLKMYKQERMKRIDSLKCVCVWGGGGW
jgi:hypothetical protein